MSCVHVAPALLVLSMLAGLLLSIGVILLFRVRGLIFMAILVVAGAIFLSIYFKNPQVC